MDEQGQEMCGRSAWGSGATFNSKNVIFVRCVSWPEIEVSSSMTVPGISP